MESKRVAMLVTMMIVMVMGNLLAQTEAQIIPFAECYPACILECKIESKFPKNLICPFSCIKTCLHHPTPSSPSPSLFEETIDQTHDFCKLGCAVHQCASLSTIDNPNVEKVASCVDSCSNKCSNKN